MSKSFSAKKISQKIGRGFCFLTESLVRLLLMAAAVLFIGAAAYWFGHQLFYGLRGGDTANNLAIVYWFDHWFPQIPLWYPLQGGGVSLVYGYHFLAHLLTVVLSRLSSLSLANAYQVLGFLSVPLTALGLYFFVWTRLKNQTTALITGFFYFLSPIAWVWLFDWGFYGEAVSYLFLPPALLFFDLFYSRSLKKKFDWLSRLGLVLGVLFLMMAWLTHAMALLGIIFFFPFYGILYPLLKPKKIALKKRLKKTGLGLFLVLVFLGFTYLLASFHELHFQYYSLQTGNAGSASREFFFRDASEWYFKPFLSLGEIPVSNRRFAERNVALAVPVWALAVLGLLASPLFSRKVVLIGLYSLLSFVFIFYPTPVWRLLNLTGAQHYRPLIISLRLFLPILAAFGITALPQLFWSLLFSWQRYLKGFLKFAFLKLRSVLVAFSALALSLIVVITFRYYATEPPIIRYGPNLIDFSLYDDQAWPYLCPSADNPFRPELCRLSEKEKIDQEKLLVLCSASEKNGKKLPDFCSEKPSLASLEKLAADCYQGRTKKETAEYCQAVLQPLKVKFSPNSWPSFKLKGNVRDVISGVGETFLGIKEENEPVRVDVSASLGGVTQDFNILNHQDSMVNLWGYQASLNHSYWGYQQNSFYNKGQKSIQMANVAKWFGAQYVLLNEGANPVENFTQASDYWEKKADGIFRFTPRVKLYSFSSQKPRVLVIGSQKLAAYETLFRLANNGVLNYDQAFLVMGKERVDAYSLKELQEFQVLILFGYDYRNQRKAFGLLDQYLKAGGRVFLSTGWQYHDHDWQISQAPAFFPVNDLSWQADLSKNAAFEINLKPPVKIRADKFGALTWGNQPWGVSLPGGVRDWAKTYLTVGGKPILVAGNYGKGQIVWTGLNWPGHIDTFNQNSEEIIFLNWVFTDLLGKKEFDEEKETALVSMDRDFPDKVVFTFSQASENGTLYFRESYHPDWQAYVVSDNQKTRLPIYQSGPLYQLVILPKVKAGDQLIFEYANRVRGVLAKIVSALTLIVLLAYLFFGNKLLSFFKKILVKAGQPVLKMIDRGQKKWSEE